MGEPIRPEQQRSDSSILSNSSTLTVEPLHNNSEIFSFGPSVKIEFEDVFHGYNEDDNKTSLGSSIGKLLKSIYAPVFYWTQAVIYYILAVPIGAIVMVAWGIVFGLNKLIFIWFVQPFAKLIFVWLRLAGTIYRATIRTVCDPCAESSSLIWRNIRGQFTVNANARLGNTQSSSVIVDKTSFVENENAYSSANY